MTFKGPFQPKLFCGSMILPLSPEWLHLADKPDCNGQLQEKNTITFPDILSTRTNILRAFTLAKCNHMALAESTKIYINMDQPTQKVTQAVLLKHFLQY